jgi:hypothetical protein
MTLEDGSQQRKGLWTATGKIPRAAESIKARGG